MSLRYLCLLLPALHSDGATQVESFRFRIVLWTAALKNVRSICPVLTTTHSASQYVHGLAVIVTRLVGLPDDGLLVPVCVPDCSSGRARFRTCARNEAHKKRTR
jgi:hypothetical protein